MSTDERYDEATVRLVAESIEVLVGMPVTRSDPDTIAESILAALADAGLLRKVADHDDTA